MKKNILSFVFLCALFVSCGDDQPQQQARGPMQVPVIELPTKTLTDFNTYPVSIEGVVNSEVRPKVSGYITKVVVDEGQSVKQGDVLFTLETESLSQDAQAAQANVNAARVEVEKLKPLVDKEIISKSQLETAKAKLAQAKASYSSIAANIDYATIKSPVDGVVGSIRYRNGSLVSPESKLTTVSQVDEVYAFFGMNEKDYITFLQHAEGKDVKEKIANFQAVKLELATGDVYEHEGEIQTVSGQVNPQTGTVNFRAKFPNPGRLLANGNSGRIMIPETYEDKVVVPESASFERQGLIYVYGIKDDSLAVSKSFQVDARVKNFIIVKSGLEKGQKIIADGVGQIRNNMPVKPQLKDFDSIVKPINKVFK
ncbi:efflux transporter periplasmic adaptor subunit [Psychroflexus sp. S27]|uniref:efflux RND transporter periplasmic adaptor subunit n=1 Tax=Psychroflexus sp. S27 TaxID=1982757 RepID=UPI000C2A5030|nr:efflux RND transporter periplasmic adaptor subunit [Psychroflexus sp. S27]PJX24465.1 efflux transporter periplasmic adaptor subunit [Psychroflexus sp. S27]